MSKSKSSSASSQSSATTDNKIVAEAGAVAASGGSTINFLSSDVALAALETARDLGESSLAFSGQAISGVVKIADQNAAITEASRVDNNNLARDLANTAISKVEQNARPVEAQVLGVVGKYGAIIAAVVAGLIGLALVFRRQK